MAERFPITVERMRMADDAYCEGCDNGDDGMSASAYVSVGPCWNVKHVHLCNACIARLQRACATYLRAADKAADHG